MPIAQPGQNDPNMLGVSQYVRNPLDFYVTPKRAVEALLSIIGDDLPAWQVWEPFCGDGAFSAVIKPWARDILSTDIRAYEGFDPDGLIDFFNISPDHDHYAAAMQTFTMACALEAESEMALPMRMADIEDINGFMPDAIITNPPYGKDADRAARHAIKLMEASKGVVIFLCRQEWDSAKGRADLFDHPAFAMKITLRHRPRWIANSKGAPRHNYAFYVWNWAKPKAASPEIRYAA